MKMCFIWQNLEDHIEFCIGVFLFDVGHYRVLHVWGETVTTGKNS